MANEYLKSTETCPACQGTGKNYTSSGGFPEEPVITESSCSLCSGTGVHRVSTIQHEEGIFPTYKIAEATDDTEYSVLSAAQKSTFSLILSLGEVDLSEGTAVRTKLWNMFGEGTTTRTNLEALVA